MRIIIAGCGLMGQLLAWKLTEEGHQITIIEQGALKAPRSAAHTAAAMISPLTEVVVSERIIYELGIRSMSLWDSWLKEKSWQPFYTQKGSLVVAHGQDESELLQFQQELAYHLGSQNTCQWVDQAQLHQLEPDIAEQFDHALFLPDEAHLENRAFHATLIEYLTQHCNIMENSVFTATPTPSINGEAITDTDLIIDCRGVGAHQNTAVRGVRGEVIWVETHEVTLQRPVRFMHPRYKLYIVPKSEHRFIIGATEIESEDRSPISVRSALELCSALYTLNPAFAEARILEMDTNLRPCLMDNLPQIQSYTLSDQHGAPLPYMSINGLYRHGYLLAPALTQMCLDLINDKKISANNMSLFNEVVKHK